MTDKDISPDDKDKQKLQDIWGEEEVLAFFQKRRLERGCPPLKAYLYSGAKVLDVGCSAGAITLEVATKVRPGVVVGLDTEEKAIEQATALAERAQVSNITFQVGDASSLEFDEATFDLTYSLNLLVWLPDPVRALQEQRRVTKLGGWVTAQLTDYGDIIFYPACPAVEKYLAVLPQLNDPTDRAVFIDSHQARRTLALFSQAGFKEIKIEGWVFPDYQGSEHLTNRYHFWQNWFDLAGPLAPLHQKLFALGAIDEETILTAQRELDAWQAHPHAFYTHAMYLAAGRVR